MKQRITIKRIKFFSLTRAYLPLTLSAGVLVTLPLIASAQLNRGGGGAEVGRSQGYNSPGMTPTYSQPSYHSAPNYARPSYTLPPVQTYSRPNYTVPSYNHSPNNFPLYGAPSMSSPIGTPNGSYGPSRVSPDFNSAFQRTQPMQDLERNAISGYRLQAQGTGPNQKPTYRYMPSPNHVLNASPHTINNLVTNSANYIRNYNTTQPYRYRFGEPHENRFHYNFGCFSAGLAFSPFYAPYFSLGYTALSPFAYYDYNYSPFIVLGGLYSSPPQYVYVPYPVYQDGAYQGTRNEDVDSYYLNRNPNPNQNPTQNPKVPDNTYRIGEGGNGIPKDRALDTTVNDLSDAWKTGKIDSLAKHVRRDAKVAVYLRGKYQYSMEAGDYLDMTRDALAATKTVRFDIDTVQRKQKDVYIVIARHIYRDKDGNEHTVHVNYVLEKADKTDMDYIITQVGSAPDKIEE